MGHVWNFDKAWMSAAMFPLLWEALKGGIFDDFHKKWIFMDFPNIDHQKQKSAVGDFDTFYT